MFNNHGVQCGIGLICAVIFAAGGLPAFAGDEDIEVQKPISCRFEAGKTMRVRTCREYNPDAKVNLNGVCRFHGGKWHFGNLRYKKGVGSFQPLIVCSGGVDVNTVKKSIVKVGPRLSTSKKGSGKSAYYEGVASALPAGKIPGACYRQEYHGVPDSVVSCDQSSPNDKGFCEIKDVGSKGTFRGTWWVIYNRKDKKGPVICRGGILGIDEATANDVEP